MDRTRFFDALKKRGSGVFGTSLSQAQVDGINAILAACDRNGVWPLQHRANILAQVYRETGGYMLGIKETVYPSHKDKNPSDATVIKRLDAAWKKGQLGKVKTPYWRDGWFGRGPIQVTHKDNYVKFEAILGVPLTKKPELALDPIIGADIAVIGMSRGLFTGKKLSDYPFPDAIDYPSKDNPRRIVNGPDGSDKEVAGFHRAFADALRSAGYVGQAPKPTPVPPAPLPPVDDPVVSVPPAKPVEKSGWVAALVAALAKLLGKK